jgi:predicted RNA-binding Zn-ribbon protein involved in translation (DUF1610 family)
VREPPRVGERRSARVSTRSIRTGARSVTFSFACPQCTFAVRVRSATARTVGEVRSQTRCRCATLWETQPYSDRPDDMGTLIDVTAIESPLRAPWERQNAAPPSPADD